MNADGQKRRNQTLAIRRLQRCSKKCHNHYAKRLYNIGQEETRIELENCKSTTQEGVEKEINEPDDARLWGTTKNKRQKLKNVRKLQKEIGKAPGKLKTATWER